MAKGKGINKITLNEQALCLVISDWLNSGGQFSKTPITILSAKQNYEETFDFTFAPIETEKEEAPDA